MDFRNGHDLRRVHVSNKKHTENLWFISSILGIVVPHFHYWYDRENPPSRKDVDSYDDHTLRRVATLKAAQMRVKYSRKVPRKTRNQNLVRKYNDGSTSFVYDIHQ